MSVVTVQRCVPLRDSVELGRYLGESNQHPPHCVTDLSLTCAGLGGQYAVRHSNQSAKLISHE